MKAHVRRPLLIIIFVVFSLLLLLLLFHFIQVTSEKRVPLNRVVSKKSLGLPLRLIIPAINVNARIQYVGVTSGGEIGVPNNTTDVGWFNLGSRPGQKGSAVIAGHFDGQNGEAGVFTNLYKLKAGDKIYIEYGKGVSIVFMVRESRTYDPGYADDVFISSDGVHLNLITCDGVWDGAKKSYNKRLVVFADLTPVIK